LTPRNAGGYEPPQGNPTIMQTGIIVAALALAGCGATGLQRAATRDTEDAYRAFLSANPEGEAAADARERLTALAFQRARRGDDIASYNRFLAEFPEGDHADQARELRALARLRRAIEQGGAAPLRQVIDGDPDSRAAREARQHLERAEAAEVVTSDEPARLRAYLLAFPQGEERTRVERRLDDMEFSSASSAGEVSPLRSYLQAHPRGMHRAEALDAIDRLEADLAIASGAPEDMERFLRDHPGSASDDRVRAVLAEGLVVRAEMMLDERYARRAVALAPESPAAENASRLVSMYERGGKRLALERDLVADLLGPMEVRDADALRGVLESHDPLDAWNAVREAALSSDPATIDILVRAAGMGDPLLLFYARAALSSRVAADGGATRGRIEQWLTDLRGRSSNPEDLLRLGAVNEALDDIDAAATAYRRAIDHQATAVAGAVHLALIAVDNAPTSERDEAFRMLIEAARPRAEELLDLAPDDVDIDRRDSSVVVLRGLEALGRLLETVIERASAPTPEGADAPAGMDEIGRLAQAVDSAAGRLLARLRVVDEDIESADGADPLARAAAERRDRRLRAAERLGEMRATRAVAALLDVASRDEDELGREAIRALGRISGNDAREALLSLARNDQVARAHRSVLVTALRTVASGAPAEIRRALLDAAAALEVTP